MLPDLHEGQDSPSLFFHIQHDLRQSMTRRIVLAICGGYLLYCTIAPIIWPALIIPLVYVVAPFALICAGLSIWLIPKHLRTAQLFWFTGLIVAITLTIQQIGLPEIAFFYTLLPFLATVTMGWRGGLFFEGLILIFLSNVIGHLGITLPDGYGLATIAGGMVTGLLGYIAVDPLMTVTHWSLYYSAQWRDKLNEARDAQVELKQVQQDLILANNQLAHLSDRLKGLYQVAEEARKAKEEFVANVSHEFRTPLNMIIGFSEMITRTPAIYGTDIPAPLLADIATIKRNSQHLSKLVDDVLDLSQVEAGRMALNKEWVDIKDIVNAAVSAIKGLFDSKGLYLQVEVQTAQGVLFCDSTRIRQVVLNLLSNASRFTERGGVGIRVWQEPGFINISVADTGPGISEEDQKKLFEPFQQLDGSIRRRYGGSGLGLSISKQFVELHGGKMWLESQVGKGTTFFFRLPASVAPPDTGYEDRVQRWFNPYETYEPRQRPFKAPQPKITARFLIMEQGDALYKRFCRFVENVDVVQVKDEPAISDALSIAPAQAVIINTPTHGEIATEKKWLMDLPYGTPVLTCWVPGEEEAARRLGVVDYLVKPVANEHLLASLNGLGTSIKRILLVDDEPDLLRLFTRILKTREPEYHLLRAESGQRALTLMRERRPDVILLDLYMPGMDGYQVLQEKSQDPEIRDIPVIVVSSRDPIGEQIVSDTLTITRNGGLSMHYLLDCIQAVTKILSHPTPPADLKHLEMQAELQVS